MDAAKLAEIKQELVTKSRKGVWIDVRTPEEFNAGHIDSAVNIPYEEIAKAQSLVTDKNAVINLYCKSGRRASIAEEALVKAGYTNVVNFGGYNDLKTLF